ncbi:hypothetical protein [Streptomyces sparsogenes]|uniref:hypothetical protein n=1 Tax=Streptomyces sparsogenes TaxID=67365 RepID=UPI0033C13FCB
MDAAVAGLIGSLGGVVVGATAQALQSSRSRRWQLVDQERASKEQREAQLWQDRRTVYAAFMAITLEVTNQLNWVVATRTTSQEPGDDDSRLPPLAQEAMNNLSEMIKKVLLQADEVRLITESADVTIAVSAYIQALVSFSPTTHRTDDLGSFEETQGLIPRLIARHRQFTSAARQELGMQPQAGQQP